MRQSLLDAEVTKVTASYNGSDDEGCIHDIDGVPEDLDLHVDDFLWEFLQDETPYEGFHNGDGGYGTIVWDVQTNQITIHHHDYVTNAVDRGVTVYTMEEETTDGA